MKKIEQLYRGLLKLSGDQGFRDFVSSLSRDQHAVKPGKPYRVVITNPSELSGGVISGLLVSFDPDNSGGAMDTPAQSPLHGGWSSASPFPGPSSGNAGAGGHAGSGVVTGYQYLAGEGVDSSKRGLRMGFLEMTPAHRNLPDIYLKIRKSLASSTRFKTGRDGEALFISIPVPSDGLPYPLEFEIKVGMASLSGLEELIDIDSEYPAIAWQCTDQETVSQFLDDFEQGYFPDSAADSEWVDVELGSGISSQVTCSAYFLRSLAIKRTLMTCDSLAQAKQVIIAAMAHILILKLVGIPVAPIRYTYVRNKTTRMYAIYALQRRYDSSQFADSILTDSQVTLDEKKKLIDQMLEMLQKCDSYNATQALENNESESAFTIAIDPNFPNFCQLDEGLFSADFSPFFMMVTGDFLRANQFVVDMEMPGRAELFRSMCSNPLMTHTFFLTMLWREWQKYQIIKLKNDEGRLVDEVTASLAEIMQEVYDYALERVNGLPHIRVAIRELEEVAAFDRCRAEQASICRSPAARLLELMQNPRARMSCWYAEACRRHHRIQSLYSRVFDPEEELQRLQSACPWPFSHESYSTYLSALRGMVEAAEDTDRETLLGALHYQAGNIPDSNIRIQSSIVEELGTQITERLSRKKQPINAGNSSKGVDRSILSDHEQTLFFQYSLNIRFIADGVREGTLTQALISAIKNWLSKNDLSEDLLSFLDDSSTKGMRLASDPVPVFLRSLAEHLRINFDVILVYPDRRLQPAAVRYTFSGKTVSISHLKNYESIRDLARRPNVLLLSSRRVGNDQPATAGNWSNIELAEEAEAESEVPASKRIKVEPSEPESLASLRLQGMSAVYIAGGRIRTGVACASAQELIIRVITAATNYLDTGHIRDLPWRNVEAAILSRLPKNLVHRCVDVPSGSMLSVQQLMIAFLDYLHQTNRFRNRKIQFINIVLPAIDSTLDSPRFAIWTYGRKGKHLYEVRKQFLYGVNVEEIVQQTSQQNGIAFFVDTPATPVASFLAPAGEQAVENWWLMTSEPSEDFDLAQHSLPDSQAVMGDFLPPGDSGHFAPFEVLPNSQEVGFGGQTPPDAGEGAAEDGDTSHTQSVQNEDEFQPNNQDDDNELSPVIRNKDIRNNGGMGRKRDATSFELNVLDAGEEALWVLPIIMGSYFGQIKKTTHSPW
ncbi:hypothetical protein [Endozoicomonas sp. OPT23]|uniref:hypothetical protein n=1 Tax=Endozoicomonas sp. OPT23 TaxID=2072845 RepID=UPI00129B3904|nr:hypothetical protein [Endozoicomonas sp. OPT23]